jgi:hypothetical protein
MMGVLNPRDRPASVKYLDSTLLAEDRGSKSGIRM